jgi:hypothetical protein
MSQRKAKSLESQVSHAVERHPDGTVHIVLLNHRRRLELSRSGAKQLAKLISG